MPTTSALFGPQAGKTGFNGTSPHVQGQLGKVINNLRPHIMAMGAQEVNKVWGPVVTDTNDAYHIGAERATNNTAELSTLAHARAWARALSSAVLFVVLSAPMW